MLRKRRRRTPGVENLEARLCMAAPTEFPGSPITLPTDGAWRSTPFLGSPIFADLNNDGRDELITPAVGGRLIAYTSDPNGNISVFKTYETGSEASFKTTPVVLDNPNGGGKILIDALGRDESNDFSLEDGRVFAFNAETGAVLPGWPQNTDRPPPDARRSSGVTGSIGTGDLTGDGVPEIVVTSFSTMVAAFKLDGTKLWSFANDETVEPGAVIADLDRDGKNEVVYASGISASPFYPNGGMITILNGTGALQRRIFTDEVFFSSPIVTDLDGNGTLEIVALGGDYFHTAGGNRIYAWNYKGEMMPGWPYKTTNNDSAAQQFWRDPVAADLTGDGRPEIVAIDRSGRLHVVGPNGQALSGFVGGKVVNPDIVGQQFNDAFSTPIIADINGDGQQDIVVAHKFRVKAFDAKGNEIWAVTPPVTPGAQLPQAVDTAAAVGQFDGRRGLELAFLSNSTNNPHPPRSLSIYTLDPSSASPVWPMDRRDARGQAIYRAPSFVNGYVAGAYQTLLHRDPTDSERNAGVDALMNNQTNLFEFARMVVNSGGEAIWGGQLNDATAGSIQDRFGPIYQATTGNGTIPADSLAAMLFDAHRGTSGTELAARSYASGGNYASTNFLAGWVRSIFRDVLNREAVPGETAAMLNVLDAGTTTPGQLVDFLLGTPEARVNYVKDQVRHYLGREATLQDIAGLVYYVRREDVIISIVASPEYYQRAGGTTEGLVRAAYRDILNIPNAPANEVQFWVAQLTARSVQPPRGRRPRPRPNPTAAATPASFADAMTKNAIYRDAWVVDTLMKYTPDISRGVLRVPLGVPGGPINPDPGIVNNFTTALSLGYSQTDILAALMTSFNYYFSASYNRGIFTGWGVRR